MTALAQSAERRCPTCGDAPRRDLVETVRRALVEAALGAYDDAGLSGLCAEGRWEAAVSALRTVDLDRVTDGAGAVDQPPRQDRVSY